MMNPWKRPWLFPLYGIAAALVFGALVMLLWNAIIPSLTGWAMISYPKAVGLLVLCRILFGGFRGRHGMHGGPPWRRHGHWRERWMHMSPEEREKMRTEWRRRCGWSGPPASEQAATPQ